MAHFYERSFIGPVRHATSLVKQIDNGPKRGVAVWSGKGFRLVFNREQDGDGSITGYPEQAERI